MDLSFAYHEEGNVSQGLYDVFEEYRRGKAIVLNPEDLYVSVGGWHPKKDKYVKFEGDAYELAEIQIKGTYVQSEEGPAGTQRPFMYHLKELLEQNTGRYAKQIFNENIWYDRHQKGWFVEWDAVKYQLQNVCIENLMPMVSADMPPVSKSTQKKKSRYGYGDDTLYATGKLAELIYVEII